jgi:murein DD-endopeptidase MepM/ murein hydrolase activator NlpD
LPDLTGENFSEFVSNPFLPPAPGSDDPHQGLDLALLDPATRIALPGSPVAAILPGTVAAVIEDRFPYGYALLVETPLEVFAEEQLLSLNLPTPIPTREGHPVLTCPTPGSSQLWDFSRQSIYSLYAHLQAKPEIQPGDKIACGQTFGQIGQSGNALHPHVHIEIRLGPAEASFNSLAHYIGNASPEEMWNYCQWRVSGAFQLVDPNLILQFLP